MTFISNQVTDKSKRGFVTLCSPSPHPLILNRPTPLDLSYSGLEEFQHPEINGYGPRNSGLNATNVCDRESNNSMENTDDSLTQQLQVSVNKQFTSKMKKEICDSGCSSTCLEPSSPFRIQRSLMEVMLLFGGGSKWRMNSLEK
ncbi:hypothetical protein Tco_1265444 [Tanacetum coccineum]